MQLKLSLILLSLIILLTLSAPSQAQLAGLDHAQVSGRVESSDGTPVPSALIRVLAWGGGIAGTGTTDDQGRYFMLVSGSAPYRFEVIQGAHSETVNVDSTQLNNFVLHLQSSSFDKAPASPASEAVSINDLQAPAKAKSAMDKARAALRKLQLDPAMRYANEAIRLAPLWGRPYALRGVLYMEARNFGAAESDLKMAVTQDPSNVTALTELGKLDSLTGKWQDSSLYLHRALQYPPVLWPTYYELTVLDLLRGNYAEAQSMAAQAEHVRPPAPAGIHFLAGEAANLLHQPAAAAREYQQFIALAGNLPQAQPQVARARQRLQQIKSSPSVSQQPAQQADSGSTPNR